MTGLWIAVGVLGVLLVGGLAGGFLLLAMGRLHLDLGWGRSFHELGPIEVRIGAPRDLLFEMIREPYLGHTPRHVGDRAPITVPRDMTAEPADAVGNCQRGRADVGGDEPGNFVLPRDPGKGERAA